MLAEIPLRRCMPLFQGASIKNSMIDAERSIQDMGNEH
jgi:hypothetical protein